MRTALSGLAGLTLAAGGGMLLWRAADHRADRAEMDRLLALQPAAPPRFDPGMVADLPEPARRFFRFAIAEGTPLRTVAEIGMRGLFSLEAGRGHMPMRASQVLAAPHGFVWAMAAGRGAMRLSGSDSGRWTRFWLAGAVPVARLGGGADHARSAFGRMVAEAAFWTPAALLPGPGVAWQAADPDSARVTVSHGNLVQDVTVTVDAGGRPLQVAFPRWSNANPRHVWQVQPFGGHLSGFRAFGGFRLPADVEAGNFFGTEDYFPFFVAEVTGIRFPAPRRRASGRAFGRASGAPDGEPRHE